MTRESLENAVRVLLAIGGSTNGVVHLAAIAGRAGLTLDLHHLNALSDSTPVLVNLKPTGQHYMEDLHAAGGLGAVLQELKPLLHLECRSVTGETLEERLGQRPAFVDRNVIRPVGDPFRPSGGLLALFGNLAPNGSILKCAAADERLFEHEGRAVVFTDLNDLAMRVDDPLLDVRVDDVLVLQNAGPIGAGMPEAGYLPIPAKLARAGVKDMVRISDARMSGTAFGTVILHVSPETAVGGPLGLVRSGDTIRLSVKERRVDVLLSDAELARRRQRLPLPKSIPSRGYARLYAQSVLGAEFGLPATQVTVSSDGGGCLPAFDGEGRVKAFDVGRPSALGETLEELLAGGHALERVLPAFTSNPARVLRLPRKGHLSPGADADLVVLDAANRIADVMARGRWHVRGGVPVLRGVFERAEGR